MPFPVFTLDLQIIKLISSLFALGVLSFNAVRILIPSKSFFFPQPSDQLPEAS